MITDLRMPELSGLDLLARVRAERLPVGVIVLTAFGDPTEALQAMKAGADDFVTKPYDPDQLRFLVKRILERRELIDELEQLRKQASDSYRFHTMVSKSPKMRKIFDLIEQVGPIGSTVLIQGETGTGKELVAQAVHAADTRRARPVRRARTAPCSTTRCSRASCSATRRAPSPGAERRKIGRFELADGGTLLLDEAGDIPPRLQAKLLRVLQTGQFERVGGTETDPGRRPDHRGQPQEARGRGQDGPVPRRPVLPAERDPDRPAPAPRADRGHPAPGDALPRAAAVRSGGTRVTEIDSDAMQALLRHTWPGNVRELENAIKAAVAMADGPVLHRDALPESVAPRTSQPLRGSSLIDIDRPLPDSDRRPHRPGRARVLHPAPLAVQGERRRAAHGTAACRGGASPRSSRSTPSTGPSSRAPSDGRPLDASTARVHAASRIDRIRESRAGQETRTRG